jgi:hypothetical protein
MRVPKSVLRAVAFLGYRANPGFPETERFGGTGFVVGIDLGGLLFLYLATADHVAKQLEDYHDPVARLNDIDGNGYIVSLPPKGPFDEIPDPWYRHPTDKSADVAVRAFVPRECSVPFCKKGTSNVAYAPERLFVRDLVLDETRIGIGDEVFIPGLFHFAQGRQSNTPILRTGNLAMIPNEKVNSRNDYDEMDAYLIEVQSISALSGSPVFVRRTVSIPAIGRGRGRRVATARRLKTLSTDYSLLGLIHGHWDIPTKVSTQPGSIGTAGGEVKVNSGIAIVTPAIKLLETLYQPRLIREREDFVNGLSSEKGK